MASFGPRRPQVGRLRSKVFAGFGPKWDELGPSVTNIGPASADCGQMWPNFGSHRPNSGPFRPTEAEIGQIGPIPAQPWPTSDRSWAICYLFLLPRVRALTPNRMNSSANWHNRLHMQHVDRCSRSHEQLSKCELFCWSSASKYTPDDPASSSVHFSAHAFFCVLLDSVVPPSLSKRPWPLSNLLRCGSLAVHRTPRKVLRHHAPSIPHLGDPGRMWPMLVELASTWGRSGVDPRSLDAWALPPRPAPRQSQPSRPTEMAPRGARRPRRPRAAGGAPRAPAAAAAAPRRGARGEPRRAIG